MPAIRGNSGVLQLDNAGTPTTVLSLTSYTLDTTQDTAETSAMGSTARTYIKTMQSYSGSADFILDDTTPQHDGISVLDVFSDTAETATMLLYPEGDAAASGDIELTGEVIITGYSVTGSFDGVVTGSLTFQGTGSLTMAVD